MNNRKFDNRKTTDAAPNERVNCFIVVLFVLYRRLVVLFVKNKALARVQTDSVSLIV